MNPTSRAILQSVLNTDASLSEPERIAMQRLLDGVFESTGGEAERRGRSDDPILITQKFAAKLLSVSRVTVWRLARDHVLHPVEILPGTWRYSFDEIAKLAESGANACLASAAPDQRAAAA